jgi:hypothetical protein
MLEVRRFLSEPFTNETASLSWSQQRLPSEPAKAAEKKHQDEKPKQSEKPQ